MSKGWNNAIDRSSFDRVEPYIDASVGCHMDGKNQSACLIMLGNMIVHEACQNQKLVTKSSAEAELVKLSNYILEGEKVEELLMDIGKLMDEDLVADVRKVYQDNMSTIAMVKNGGGQACSKYKFIRSMSRKG